MESPQLESPGLLTGVDGLDNQFEHGIDPGTIITIVAPPLSSSEHLLYNLAGGRDTVYVTNIRPESEIEANFSAAAPDVESFTTVPIDEAKSAAFEVVSQLSQTDVPAGANIYVDAANYLEDGPLEDHVDFLRAFKQTVEDIDGLGIIHALEVGGQQPAHRWLTLQNSDMVFTVHTEAGSDGVNEQLVISKLYGEQSLDGSRRMNLDQDHMDVTIKTERTVS